MPLRLGPKLNLSLLVFMLVLGVATTVLVLVGFNRSQDNAAEVSREGLVKEGVRTLQALSQQQAYIGELQLSPAAEWGHQAAAYLALQGKRGPEFDASTLRTAPSGATYDAGDNRQTDLMLLPGVELTPRVLQDARESQVLNGFFGGLFTDYEGRMLQEAFRPIAIFYLSVDGLTRYFPPTSRLLDAETTLADVEALHSQLGPDANPGQRTYWTPPYVDDAGRGLVLTAYSPVYDAFGYRGAMGVDVSLALLTEQVEAIAPSAGGFAFYVDQEGAFLRTANFDTLQALAAEGANPPFRAAVDDMIAGNNNVARFRMDGRDMVVAYSSMPTVGGSLALVAPVDELTAEAAGVVDSIQSEGNRTLLFIILVMAFLFVLALGSTAWLNRRLLLAPIESLVSGTRAVASGNFNASIPVRSNDELGDLAASFNRMIQEVRTRNDALIREISEREQTARMLAEREESTRQIFQSVSDAIFITDMEDRIVDANVAAQEMYGYGLEELQALEPFTLVHPASRVGSQEYLDTVSEGRPFRARTVALRKDGSTFMADVFGTRAMYFGQPHILSVIRDVTEDVEQQQLLEKRVEERTRELSLLLDVSNTVASTLDMQQLFSLVLDQLAEVVPFTGGSVLVLEGQELVTQYARGPGTVSDSSTPLQQRFPAEGLRQSLSELLRGRPVVVSNVRGDTAFARDFRWMAGEAISTTFSRVVSWMALPMVHKGRFVGVVAVSSDQEGQFSDRYANLGMAIANQAAIAIENARLFAEAERRASEMAALSRIATTLDLGQSVEATLNSVAQRVVESTSAVAASLSTVAPDGSLWLGGQCHLPEGFFGAVDAAIRRGAPRPNERALSTHRPVVINSVREFIQADESYSTLRPLIGDAEWDTIVIVPMRYGDRDLGTLETYYRSGESPDEREISLLSAMARQAATSIENAVLFSQTEKRVRQLEALQSVASSFSLEVSLPELMDRMSEQIVRATTATAAAVALADTPESNIRVIGTARLPDGFAEKMEESYRRGGGSTARIAMREMRTIYQGDLRRQRLDDPRYSPVSAQMQEQPWDSILLTPLIYRNRALGVLLLGYPLDVDPDTEERAFVEAITDQMALVVENAQLYQRASSAAALEERQRLARDLHDSVSQALYGIALGARTARRRVGDDGPANVTEPLDYVLSLAEAGLTEMRALIFELRPESIAEEGLIAAIGRQVASTQSRYGVRVTSDLCDEPDVSLDIKEAVYRVAQESMHNTVKHARATNINVALVKTDGALRLELRDDGQGFDPAGEFPGHLGLRSMRERARGVAATLDIESAPGVGTTITMTVPLAG